MKTLMILTDQSYVPGRTMLSERVAIEGETDSNADLTAANPQSRRRRGEDHAQERMSPTEIDGELLLRPASQIMHEIRRILLFLAGGSSAAALNLALAYVGVDLLGFRSGLEQNFINFVAMEISLIYSFFVYRTCVWRIKTLNATDLLLRQLPLYHLSAGTGVLTRVLLFPLLQLLGVHYLVNIALGILAGSSVNYALSSRYVFKEHACEEHP